MGRIFTDITGHFVNADGKPLCEICSDPRSEYDSYFDRYLCDSCYEEMFGETLWKDFIDELNTFEWA